VLPIEVGKPSRREEPWAASAILRRNEATPSREAKNDVALLRFQSRRSTAQPSISLPSAAARGELAVKQLRNFAVNKKVQGGLSRLYSRNLSPQWAYCPAAAGGLGQRRSLRAAIPHHEITIRQILCRTWRAHRRAAEGGYIFSDEDRGRPSSKWKRIEHGIDAQNALRSGRSTQAAQWL
jgi:hypothetical protein